MTTVTQDRHVLSNNYAGRPLPYPEPPPLGFIQEEKEYCNRWADYWRNEIGVNVIPAITKNRIIKIKWAEYQDKPIPEWQHNQWKNEFTFSEGLAIIPGRVWHREDRKDMYLIFLDLDKRIAIEEVSTWSGKTIPLQEMAQKFLVEQHSDNSEKAHIYFYSPIPFPKKSADEVLGLEIKGMGKHGIAFCSPSIHKNGHRYEVIGTKNPVVLNLLQARELIQHVHQICIKNGLPYLEVVSSIDSKLKSMTKNFVIDSDVRILKGNRHNTLISVADSFLLNHLGRGKKIGDLKEFFYQINDKLCDPNPLPKMEIESIWNSAMDFVQRIKKNQEQPMQDSEEEIDIIEQACESIKREHRLVTIEVTKDILFYCGGVYVPGGEVLIEKKVELTYDYDVSNKVLAEIRGHIMRSTYHSAEEFDSDINIINVKNGLYNITQGKLKEHTPDYLSLNQIPIVFNPRAKTKRIGKFLREVLYPKEIRTAIEIMAYTFHRDNPFEIITTLFGYGANGKSVFISLLTSLHGMKNVSNVPLSALLKDIFALSDLENKSINFDTELSAGTVNDTAILKKLTGSQPVRIQRKNQRAYDTVLYTKLFFSANKILQTTDDSDAYYRRNIILSFPNQFEEGRNADTDLKIKLTTEEELSGIFNVLMTALRNLLKNKKIFVHEKSIQERRGKYELAVNPIEYFKQEVIAEDLLESDRTLKETLYRAYEIFVKEKKLPKISKETLGKVLKTKKYGFQDGRESSGRRRTFWKGVKLTERYYQIIGSEQQTLTV